MTFSSGGGLIFAMLQARLSLLRPEFIEGPEGEESPDSTEQCTGEEPGLKCCMETCSTAEQIVPQKMTASPSPLVERAG